MFDPVMKHVTALAKRLQVSWSVVRWVVVEMGSREHDVGRTAGRVVASRARKLGEWATSAITPNAIVFVPPSTVTPMDDLFQVGPTAMLAASLGSLKAHEC
jgi:hypothetical protein